MIRTLLIKNFILISDAKVEFSKGLNIITGESGSGKSAVLKAIDALLGARLDASCIFPQKNTAIIEAVFEIKDTSVVQKILSGYEINQNITLRREISKNGRSRFFINDQLISIVQVKECAIYFADYISQKQAASLYQDKYIRIFVDALADCKKDVEKLFILWDQAVYLRQKVNKHLNHKVNLENTIPSMKDDLNLIKDINYQQNEETQLEQKHVKLIHSQEMKIDFEAFCNILSDDPESALVKLRQADKIFQKLLSMDSNLESLYQGFQAVLIELNEISFELAKINTSIDVDNSLLNEYDERIKKIDLLKKKFGPDLSVLDVKKKQLIKNIEDFENIDNNLQELNTELSKLDQEIDKLCSTISAKRRKAKVVLENNVKQELSSLNLKDASFELILEKKVRSANGDENLNFLFSANPNTKLYPLRKIASGGELSRVMLALKCIILDKDSHNCLIFDEIDANVGGKSAAIIGDKLLKLSQHKQIICVTHFIQVAKKANAHFLIEKFKQDQQYISSISKLEESQKTAEYQRMIGHIN